MKQYLSLGEAAKQWGVSERRIGQYCTQGRIPGAKKEGISWVIPADAQKPEDLRRRSRPVKDPPAEELPIGPLDPADLMPLINTPFKPGHCREAVDAMKPGPSGTSPWRSTTISADSRRQRCGKPNPTSPAATWGRGFPPV